jgi:hypothetical protein
VRGEGGLDAGAAPATDLPGEQPGAAADAVQMTDVGADLPGDVEEAVGVTARLAGSDGGDHPALLLHAELLGLALQAPDLVGFDRVDDLALLVLAEPRE